MSLQIAIAKAVDGIDLSTEEMKAAFEIIMTGGATDAQIGAFITALRMKGESISEITGAAQVMREKVTLVIPENIQHVVDTCGTGGDKSGTFNISTAAALVAAGAGAVVAKHGNRSVSSACGSADVLTALGVNINISPEKMKECLDTVGIAFLFAPLLHKAMKFAIGPRKEIGLRTIFNVLGPLTNPARAKHQLLGVYSPDLTEPLALALRTMGSDTAYVVYGCNGMDEISISDETRISELRANEVKTYRISPEDFGLKRSSMETIAGGDAALNAGIIREILSGSRGPKRDIVLLNAAFAIAASDLCATPKDGISLAEKSIDSGAAMAKLDMLIAVSGS